MTDYSYLPRGISKIAWGFIFILINIDIFGLDILPDFVGYIFILSGINDLKDECKTISLLRPLGIFLAIWKAVTLISGFFSVGVILSYISSIVSIIDIYFTFQLLTECSLIAAKYQSSEDNLDKTIRTRRNIHTVCITLVNITMTIMLNLPEEFQEITVYVPSVFAVVALIVLLMTVSSLFRLKRTLQDFDTASKVPAENKPEEEIIGTDSEGTSEEDEIG